MIRRKSKINILIVMVFIGLFLSGCGSKNNAPFHVYRSALVESAQQNLMPIEDTALEVRIASIGLNQ